MSLGNDNFYWRGYGAFDYGVLVLGIDSSIFLAQHRDLVFELSGAANMVKMGRIKLGWCFVFGMSLASDPLYASFIEATMGTAVIDDATAVYYNPAALRLLKNAQFIALGAYGASLSEFSGQALQKGSGFLETGTSNRSINYFLPSLYFAMPASDNLKFGVAVVANDFNSDLDGHSILRYVQANNTTQDIDLVPAIGYKFNEYVSVGAAVTYSYAHFLLQPTIGFPSLNIPDSQSLNDTSSSGWGGDVGILLKPMKAMAVGFNYRSSITYSMTGKSTFDGPVTITSNNYGFKFWTPARSVLSAVFFQTPKLSYISTVQYVQWSIFKSVNVRNIATPTGILPFASVPYNFRDSWILTLGTNYRFSPKWIVRAATTYTQAPSNGRFQIDTGDSFTLGASVGYKVYKNIIVDASYAHVFVQNSEINVAGPTNLINGTNKQHIDSVALKLTVQQ